MNKKSIILISSVLIISLLTGIILLIQPFASKEDKLFNNTVKECLKNTKLTKYIKKNDVTIKYVDDSYVSKYDDFEYFESFYDDINNEIVVKYNKDKEYMKKEIYSALGSMIFYNFDSNKKDEFTHIFDERFNFVVDYEMYKSIKFDSYFVSCYSTTFSTMYLIYIEDSKWIEDNYKEIYKYFKDIEKEIL